jgi:hypothetical protein
MNGTMYNHAPSTGFYTGNGPIHSSYQTYYPSTFTPNTRQLYPSDRYNNTNSQQTFNPLPMKSNSFNHQDNNLQRQFYTNSFQQQSTNPNVYNFENIGSAPTAYYDQIHARVRSNPVAKQKQNSISTNSSLQYPYTQPSSPNSTIPPTLANTTGQTNPTFLVVPGAQPNTSSPAVQVIYRFDYREY